jgi:hypothetical protein
METYCHHHPAEYAEIMDQFEHRKMECMPLSSGNANTMGSTTGATSTRQPPPTSSIRIPRSFDIHIRRSTGKSINKLVTR